jgi:hypothetical protein
MATRKKSAPQTRVAIYLPPALAKRLRVRCAGDGKTMSSAVAEAVQAWLGRRP